VPTGSNRELFILSDTNGS